MNYTAKDYFPDWYKVTKITVTESLVTSRIQAIDEIIQIEKKEFWLDLVRMAVGLKPKDPKTSSDFIKEFKDKDVTFPISNNEKLLETLAGITLCFKLEAQDLEEDPETEKEEETEGEEAEEETETDYETLTNLNTAISLSIINVNLLGQYKSEGIPYTEYAENYLGSKTYLERQQEEDDYEEQIASIHEELEKVDAEISTEDNQTIIKTLQSVMQKNVILSEELNILSWIFGEYSKYAKKFFQEAGLIPMITCGALELREKAQKLHFLPSAKSLLHRILTISNSSKKLSNVTVYDVISPLTPEIKSLLTKHKDNISELTPYMFAVLKSEEVEAGTDYSAPYKKATNNGDIKKALRPEVLASQIYNELVFIKTLENA
jgi:ribosomal protein L12E/L44/L45/RPP1/RPP2